MQQRRVQVLLRFLREWDKISLKTKRKRTCAFQTLRVTTSNFHMIKAVSNLYISVQQEETQKSPFELLEEFQLIGCFEGEEDLSQTYKKKLSTSLEEKYLK
jgi:hypothetical protein